MIDYGGKQSEPAVHDKHAKGETQYWYQHAREERLPLDA